MRQVRLNEELYEVAQRRAAAAGFETVDDYIADVLTKGIDAANPGFEHLFTPQRLAQIDRAAAEIDAGHGMSPQQVEAELTRRRAAWLEQNPG